MLKSRGIWIKTRKKSHEEQDLLFWRAERLMIFFFYFLHCDYFTFIFLNHKSKWKWIPVSRLHGLPPPLCGLLSPQLCLEIATSCVSSRFLYVRHPSPPQERRFQPSFLRSSNPATESFSTEWTRHSHPNETHLPCTNTCSLSGFSVSCH